MTKEYFMLLDPRHPVMVKAKQELGSARMFDLLKCIEYAQKFSIIQMSSSHITKAAKVHKSTAEILRPHVNSVLQQYKR